MDGGITAKAGSRWQELRRLLFLAAPTIVQAATQQAMLVTDRIFVGHLLGTTELAAAALGNAYCNVTILFLLGAATALDTLGATAHGAVRSKVVGAVSLASWTATAFIVLTALCMLGMASLTAAGPFSRTVLHQDEDISHLVGQFCFGLLPSICPMTWGTILMKYLQVQGVVVSPALIVLASFGINIGANMVLINHMGFMGAPTATSVSQVLQCLGLAAVTWWFVASRPRRQARAQQQMPHSETAAEGSCQPCGWMARLGACIESMLFYGAEDIACTSAPHTVGTKPASIPLESQPSGLAERAASTDSSMDWDAQCDKNAKQFLAADLCASIEVDLDPSPSHHITVFATTSATSSTSSECSQAAVLSNGSVSALAPASDVCNSHMGLLAYLGAALNSGCKPCHLWAFLKLCIPGGLLLVVEYIVFDIQLGLAAQLGTAEAAAHAIVDAIVTFSYMSFPYAVGVAASIRLGHLLGQGDTAAARTSAHLSIVLGVGFMTCCSAVVYFARHQVGYVFTDDEQVIALVAKVAPIAALCQLADGAWGTAAGVLRGCGRQTQLMIFSAAGFLLGGVLLGALLCLKAGMGLQGLWWGLAAGELIITLLSMASLYRLSWTAESGHARQRSMGGHLKPDAIHMLEPAASHVLETAAPESGSHATLCSDVASDGGGNHCECASSSGDDGNGLELKRCEIENCSYRSTDCEDGRTDDRTILDSSKSSSSNVVVVVVVIASESCTESHGKQDESTSNCEFDEVCDSMMLPLPPLKGPCD